MSRFKYVPCLHVQWYVADIRILVLKKKFFGGFPQLSFYTRLQFTPSSEANGYRNVSLDGCPVPPIGFLCIQASPASCHFPKQMAASEQVPWRIANCSSLHIYICIYIYICLPLSYHLPRQMAGAWEKFFGGFPQQTGRLLQKRFFIGFYLFVIFVSESVVWHPTVLLYICLRVS